MQSECNPKIYNKNHRKPREATHDKHDDDVRRTEGAHGFKCEESGDIWAHQTTVKRDTGETMKQKRAGTRNTDNTRNLTRRDLKKLNNNKTPEQKKK